MNRLFANKTLAYLLAAYGLLQFSSLFLHAAIVLLAYELCYLTAIVLGTIWTVKRTKVDKDLKTLGLTVLLFLIINLLLFLLYIPTLLLNPSINWTLRGEHGSDPMILLMFWPPIHFAIALVIIGLAGFITRLTVTKEVKLTDTN